MSLISRIALWWEVRKVNRAFPGWQRTVRTAEFEEWLAKQPPETRELCASVKAKDAIAVLARFRGAAP